MRLWPSPKSKSAAFDKAPPVTEPVVDEKYRCGTLQYTKAGLFFVFSWMIFGNLCFDLFEKAGGPGTFLGFYLQDNFHISNLQVNILFNVIPMTIGTIMTPIISFKSDRTRSRLGRRIPYILFTAPFLVFFAGALGFSDDIIKYCKTIFTEDSMVSPFTAALIAIGILTVGFSFFNEFVGTVYYYLLPDVMPRRIIGRFQGVSSMVGTGAGIAINIFLTPYQLTHIKAIHVGVALLYFFGFGMLCWRVKEGEYPPVEDVSKKTGFLDQVKIFFRECFTHPIFILFYLSMAAMALTKGLNPSGIFALHLSQHQCKVEAHTSAMDAVAITPGGEWMAVGDREGLIKVWRKPDKIYLLTNTFSRCSAAGDSVGCVAIDATGALVAIGSSNGCVEVWDAVKGQCLQSMQAGHSGAVQCVAFPDSGPLLASAGADSVIKVWDVRTGANVKTLPVSGAIHSLAVTPDGGRVAYGGDKAVLCLETDGGKVVKSFARHKKPNRCLSLSADGKTAATFTPGSPIEVWDVSAGSRKQRLNCDEDLQTLAMTGDGREVSASNDRRLKVWDVASGKGTNSFAIQLVSTAVAMTLDGRWMATGGKDGIVKFWDGNDAKKPALLKTFDTKAGPVQTIALTADGRTAIVGSSGGMVQFWNTALGACVRRLPAHNGSVRGIALSPDGTRLASAGTDKLVKIWDVASGECLHTLSGHADDVNSVAFSSHGDRLVSGGSDKKIIVWDARRGVSIKTLEGNPGPVYSVCFAPALGPVPKYELPPKSVWKASFDKALSFLKKVFTNESLYDEPQDQSSKLLGDDLWVISGGRDGAKDDEYAKVRIWDVAEGKVLKALQGHKQAISCVVYKPDIRAILSGSLDGIIRLWQPLNISATATDQSHKTFSGYTAAVTAMACQNAGVKMVNASSKGMLHVWDIDQGVSLARGALAGILISLIGLFLAYPFGALVDRFNPLKIVLLCGILGLPITIVRYLVYHNYTSGLWLQLLQLPLGIAVIAAVPMAIMLYPKTKYGQMCSAAAMVRQFIGAIAGPAGAILMDTLTSSAMDTDNFRYGFLFQAGAHALSVLALVGVYYHWKKLGGNHYVAPEA